MNVLQIHVACVENKLALCKVEPPHTNHLHIMNSSVCPRETTIHMISSSLIQTPKQYRYWISPFGVQIIEVRLLYNQVPYEHANVLSVIVKKK